MGHGVYRSADYGMTWTLVNDGTAQNGVFWNQQLHLYRLRLATGGEQGQKLQAHCPGGTQARSGTWENYAPDAMLKTAQVMRPGK